MYLPLLLASTAGLLVQTYARPLLCTSPTSPSYEATLRNHTAAFHINFSKGDAGKAANGPLCALDLDWTVDNQLFIGGAAFVQQNIDFADAAFPGLQIKDQLVLVDDNLASVRYFFQGTANGHFAGLPSTGNKIEVAGGETFQYDENALLYRLIAVEPLDKIVLEVEGVTKVNTFQDITTLSNPQTPSPTAPKSRTSPAHSTKLQPPSNRPNHRLRQS
jgi:hypothetical protein